MQDATWTRLVPAEEIAEGEMLGLEVGDHKIAVYNVAGSYHATDNVCTHAFALLTDGWLDDNVIECPLHGGQFDVTTGKALCEPVECDLKVHPLRIVDGEVEVQLS